MALQDRLGDCIYDFSRGSPEQRPGVHERGNIETDLSGKNVLISRDFYYFGSNAKPLPNHLLPICHQTQGRRSKANAPYFEAFVEWARSIAPAPGQLYGWPDFTPEWDSAGSCPRCAVRDADDERNPDCSSLFVQVSQPAS
jgi:hypothetical protein